jgi:hypothetical protein
VHVYMCVCYNAYVTYKVRFSIYSIVSRITSYIYTTYHYVLHITHHVLCVISRYIYIYIYIYLYIYIYVYIFRCVLLVVGPGGKAGQKKRKRLLKQEGGGVS